MATNLPDAPVTGAAYDDAVLHVSPFYAPRYQFGMLLGVDDFDLAEAYPRGKVRLHNAWLHREGVVWGFDVTASKDVSDKFTGEIRVEPGLALDAAGRELHLDRAACLDAVAWYQKQRQDKVKEVPDLVGGEVTFDAHVELRFHACLTRPVPSMSEPCDPSSNGVAYSRVFETAELKLVPGKWARPRPDPYHLLRMLFGLEGAVDSTKPTAHELLVATALQDIAKAAPEDRAAAFLAAFRRFAARDVTALSPGKSADGTMLLFPGGDDTPIVLANLTITLTTNTGVLHLKEAVIDADVRTAHVATSTIQELNLWPGAEAAPAAAGGPRIVRGSVKLGPNKAVIEFLTNQVLDPATVHPTAFSLTHLVGVWKTVQITGASVTGNKVTLDLKALPVDGRLRLIARGRGPMPLLDMNGVPLAGADDDPRPGGQFDGNDFVHMWNG